MKTGRKGFGQELQIAQRYADLSDKVFSFLKEMYETGDKADKKWATEQASKGLIRMIPQNMDVTTAGQPIIQVAKEIIEKHEEN